MEPGGYCYSHKCSHIWALPTGTSVCACSSHMHVPASKCAYLAGFLIFWGIFRRLSWAVFLLAELFPYFFLTFHLPVPLCPPRIPASNTAACWDQACELPRAGTLLLVPPDSTACSLQVLQARNSLCVCWCSGVQYQLRGSCQESHRSRMHMEMKQDMTNLLLGQPQITQTVLSRGTAEGIFHVLSHPQSLFFRA